MSEEIYRKRARTLKKFYLEIVRAVVVCFALVLIWAFTGGGHFWPGGVMIGWGLSILFRGFIKELFPSITDVLPFLSKDWEDDQVKKMKKDKPKTPPKK